MKTLLALFALFASSALIGAMLSACGYVPPTYGCTYTADKVISCTPFFNMPVTTPVNGIHYVQASDPEAAWFHTVDDLTFEGYIHIIGNANKCNYIGDRAHMIPTMTMGIDASIYAADGGASDAGEADAGPVFCNGDAGMDASTSSCTVDNSSPCRECVTTTCCASFDPADVASACISACLRNFPVSAETCIDGDIDKGGTLDGCAHTAKSDIFGACILAKCGCFSNIYPEPPEDPAD